MKKLITGIVIAAMLLIFTAPIFAATPSGESVQLDAIIPATGPGAFLAKSYSETFHAIELAVNATGGINGKPLKIVIADSQTTGQAGLQIVNGYVAKHAQVFIDGGPSTVCNASIPVVIKNGPVDYCLSPLITPAAGSYVFSASASGADLVRVGVRYFRERGLKRVALLVANDASGQAYETATNATLALPENAGIEVVAREHFNPTDLNIAAQISRITATHPEALYLYATGTAVGMALHGMHDAALDLPMQISTSNMIYTQLAGYTAFAPKQLYFPTVLALTPQDQPRGPIRDAQNAYVKAFSAINVRPDFAHNLAWDPTMLVVDALRHKGAGADAQAIRDYILHLHSWVGVNGVYDFSGGDQRGIGENAVEVARWNPDTNSFVRVSRARGYLLAQPLK